MKPAALAAALVVSLATGAHAGSWSGIITSSPNTTIYNNTKHPIIVLGESGCIVGPFKFGDGKSVYLEIAEGVDVPAGCLDRLRKKDEK